MKYLIVFLTLVTNLVFAADINQNTIISCLSFDSALQGTHQNTKAHKQSEKAGQRFSEWLFAENFSDQKSRLKFIWTPGSSAPATIEILTTDKSHHHVRIQSLRKGNLIVVSEASDPFFNLESWTFALNFKIESIMATRVQSNVAALKAEVISYNCLYETI